MSIFTNIILRFKLSNVKLSMPYNIKKKPLEHSILFTNDNGVESVTNATILYLVTITLLYTVYL